MQKLLNDILELKTYIRKNGAKGTGEGRFGDIHSENDLLKLIYDFNNKKEKNINIVWFNQGVEIINNTIFAKCRVIISNGEEKIEEEMVGIGEEKRADIAFGLGKALTYGKRFWLQKFLDLSSKDLDPENKSNEDKNYKKISNININNEIAKYANGNQVLSKDGIPLTLLEAKKLHIKKIPFSSLTKKEIDELMEKN